MGSTNHNTTLSLRLMVRITSVGMRNIDINLLWQKEIAFGTFTNTLCKDYTITPSSSGNNPLKSALDWFSVKKEFRHPDSGEVSVTDL